MSKKTRKELEAELASEKEFVKLLLRENKELKNYNDRLTKSNLPKCDTKTGGCINSNICQQEDRCIQPLKKKP